MRTPKEGLLQEAGAAGEAAVYRWDAAFMDMEGTGRMYTDGRKVGGHTQGVHRYSQRECR